MSTNIPQGGTGILDSGFQGIQSQLRPWAITNTCNGHVVASESNISWDMTGTAVHHNNGWSVQFLGYSAAQHEYFQIGAPSSAAAGTYSFLNGTNNGGAWTFPFYVQQNNCTAAPPPPPPPPQPGSGDPGGGGPCS